MKERGSKSDVTEMFGVVLSDTLISVLGMMVILLVLMMVVPHATPKDARVLGTLCAELSWPNDRDVDLDLWGKSPDDRGSVGFTNMHGKTLHLFRDILGFHLNPSHMMYEIQCANELVPGEWTFNAVYFKQHDNDDISATNKPHPPVPMPIKARMTITFSQFANSAGTSVNIVPDKTIITKEFELETEGEEITVFDFVIDSDHHLIQNSVNTAYRPLRGSLR